MTILPVSERQIKSCCDGKHECVFFTADDMGVYCNLHPEYRMRNGIKGIKRPEHCNDNFSIAELQELINSHNQHEDKS